MSNSRVLLPFILAGTLYATADCNNKLNLHNKDRLLLNKIEQINDEYRAQITELNDKIQNLEERLSENEIVCESKIKDIRRDLQQLFFRFVDEEENIDEIYNECESYCGNTEE